MSEDNQVSVRYEYLDGKNEEEKWCSRAGLVKVSYANGDSFQGYLTSQRVKQGRGKYTYAPGNQEEEEQGLAAQCMYDGDWKDGQKHGFGIMDYGNGDQYRGTWSYNKRSGQGTYTFANGDVYSGEWVDDVKHGQGAYVFANPASQLLGTWKNGDCVKGKWVLPDETSYYGTFANGKPVENGIFYFASGLTQDGSFVARKTNDEEEAIEENEEVQERSFVRGKISVAMPGASGITGAPSSISNAPTVIQEDDEDFIVITRPKLEPKTDTPEPHQENEEKEVTPIPEDSHLRDTAQEIDAIEELFASVDVNGDGTVDILELSRALRASTDTSYAPLLQSAPDLSDDECHSFFKELDNDGDGKFDLAEFKEYFYILKLFHFVDVDGSGKVRHGELRSALIQHPEIFPPGFNEMGTSRIAVSALLSAGDIDLDRMLNFHEFVRMIIMVTKKDDEYQQSE